MNIKLEQKLIDEFPDFFVDMYGPVDKTCMSYGITHGPGWFKILRKLCSDIKDLKLEFFKFEQIKEKFGLSRIYFAAKDTDETKIKKLHLLANEAERHSAETCENCGERGSMRNHHGWLVTNCNDCDQNLKMQEKKANALVEKLLSELQ